MIGVLAKAEHAGGTIEVDATGLTSVDSHETLRIAWADALSATWADDTLTITTWNEGQSQVHAWRIADPGRLPEVVRDRVTSVILVDRTRVMESGSVVRFVARRRGDDIEWLVLPADSTWAAGPQGQAAVAAELEHLRTTLGV